MNEILELLNSLKIPYKKYEHPAVFTNEESGQIDIPEVKLNAKNLFLRAEKTHQFYLLTIKHDKRANLKAFAKTVGEKGFSFGSAEELKSLMNLTPGSVSPLGLMHDPGHKIKYFLDADILKDEKIYVHPNINTATVGLEIGDFKKFLAHTGHNLQVFNG